MRLIGILAEYLTPQHRQQIDETAAQLGFTTRYFQDKEDARAGIGDCEIIYGYFPASMIRSAVSLKWLASAAAGIDAFLPDEVYAHDGVILTSSNGSYGVTISEHLIMMSLALLRRQPEYSALMNQRTWANIGTIRSIRGSRFVIVGTGDIGVHFARRLRAMDAASVVGVRRNMSKPLDSAFDCAVGADRLKEVCADADVIAMCVPATKETEGILSKEIIDSLRPDTYVINVGRGQTIDQDALICALNEERIAGAALDVMVPEPLPQDHPLWDTKNVILTPHCSGNMTLGYTCDVNVDMFCENLRRYGKGEPLLHVVDRKVGYAQ